MKVREWQGELVFLHEVTAGVADKNYGLAMARLAGVPAPVLARAKGVLSWREANRDKTGAGRPTCRCSRRRRPATRCGSN